MRVPTPALAPAPSLSSASSYASCRPTHDELEFPAGLRVLVVDDDLACLRILDHMLQRCRYQVTTCCQAAIALSLLREKKGGYDVVVSDVHMPDMDGFKLLELVGLEMDLPVIMMSADGGTDTVMRGIKHGACDYLIKPVRMEELKNIWQHVIRKKCNGNKEQEHSSSFEDSDRRQHMVDDVDYSSSVNDGTDGTWRSHKKKRDVKEDEDGGELENEDPSAPKRPRVVWSVELHQQFVSAVNQLGIDKAVPKRILELMNVPGLTRENIASHLQLVDKNVQKFRLYLKRLHGVAQHHGAISNSFCGSVESNAQVGPLDRLDFQALAASGQIPPQTLAALHAELLGRPSGGHVFPAISKPVLLQGSVQGPKHNHIKPEVAYGQPLLKSQSNISKQIFQANFAVEDMSSGCLMWSSDHLGTTGSTRGVNSNHNGNLVMQMLEKKQPFTVPPEPNHAINVQPSCLVVPSVSSNSFQMGRSSVSLNESTVAVPSQASSGIHVGLNPAIAKQNSCRNNNVSGDHIQLSSLSCEIPFGEAQISDGDFKNASLLDGYSTLGSQSSSISFSSAHPNGNPGWRIHSSPSNVGSVSRLTNNLPDMCILGSELKTGALPTQGNGRYHGFVGKDTCIPSRFAVDDVESPNGDRVKPGFQLDFTDNSKFISNVLPYYSANDAMGVLSKDGLAGCFLKS